MAASTRPTYPTPDERRATSRRQWTTGPSPPARRPRSRWPSGEPDKIVIYTIGLNAPNQKTIDLLEDCATDDDHSFFPDDPADLTATFKLIADQLSNLRLSK